jgi:hypothetical protein
VLGYRIVSYWLPLIPGAIAYIRLRLRPDADGTKKPATPQAGGPHSEHNTVTAAGPGATG